jgi:hypothetical protein
LCGINAVGKEAVGRDRLAKIGWKNAKEMPHDSEWRHGAEIAFACVRLS